MKPCALLLSLILTLAGCPSWAEGEIVTGPDRRQEVDLRIAALEAERDQISIEGPRTATVLGLVMLVGGAVALGVGASRGGDNETPDPIGAVAGGMVLLGIGGVTALTGGIIWGNRVSRRNEIDAERESLIEERDGILAALSRLELGTPVRDGTRFVTVGFRF